VLVPLDKLDALCLNFASLGIEVSDQRTEAVSYQEAVQAMVLDRGAGGRAGTVRTFGAILVLA
jgi:hypothetical protein